MVNNALLLMLIGVESAHYSTYNRDGLFLATSFRVAGCRKSPKHEAEVRESQLDYYLLKTRPNRVT